MDEERGINIKCYMYVFIYAHTPSIHQYIN